MGVICELVEEGTEVEGKAERAEPGMMRRDACLRFGKKWGLRVCTIEDLVKFLDRDRGKIGRGSRGSEGGEGEDLIR